MSGKPEQIDAKGPLYWARNARVHRFLKQLQARNERRKAKRDPEAQPTDNKYKGWEL